MYVLRSLRLITTRVCHENKSSSVVHITNHPGRSNEELIMHFLSSPKWLSSASFKISRRILKSDSRGRPCNPLRDAWTAACFHRLLKRRRRARTPTEGIRHATPEGNIINWSSRSLTENIRCPFSGPYASRRSCRVFKLFHAAACSQLITTEQKWLAIRR